MRHLGCATRRSTPAADTVGALTDALAQRSPLSRSSFGPCSMVRTHICATFGHDRRPGAQTIEHRTVRTSHRPNASRARMLMHGEMTESLRAGPALAPPDTERPPRARGPFPMFPRRARRRSRRAGRRSTRCATPLGRRRAGLPRGRQRRVVARAAARGAAPRRGRRGHELHVPMSCRGEPPRRWRQRVDRVAARGAHRRPHARDSPLRRAPLRHRALVQCLVTRCQLADGPGAVVQHVDVTALRRQAASRRSRRASCG